jgi:hypothetical protein
VPTEIFGSTGMTWSSGALSGRVGRTGCWAVAMVAAVEKTAAIKSHRRRVPEEVVLIMINHPLLRAL